MATSEREREHKMKNFVLLSLSLLLVLTRSKRDKIPFARNTGDAELLWEEGALSTRTECGSNVMIALKLDGSAEAKLLESLKSVSNPRSKSYGKYLSLDEIVKIMENGGTLTERANRVATWLTSASTSECLIRPNVSKMGDIIRVSLSSEQIETLFGVTVSTYRHKTIVGKKRVATSRGLSLRVPPDVAKDISFVSGLNLPPTLMTSIQKLANVRGGQRVNDKSSDDESMLRVAAVENRDRAFQVHLAVNITKLREVRDRVCENTTSSPGQSSEPWECLNGDKIITSFHGKATPTRGTRSDYLDPVTCFFSFSLFLFDEISNNFIHRYIFMHHSRIKCVNPQCPETAFPLKMQTIRWYVLFVLGLRFFWQTTYPHCFWFELN